MRQSKIKRDETGEVDISSMLADIDSKIKSATTGFNFDNDSVLPNVKADNKISVKNGENSDLDIFKSKLNRFPYLSKSKTVEPIPDDDESDEDGEEVKLVNMVCIYFKL